jgi:hypothetical protein
MDFDQLIQLFWWNLLGHLLKIQGSVSWLAPWPQQIPIRGKSETSWNLK